MRSTPPEEFKIVYKTRIGSVEQEDLNMLWRLTSASYTLSSPEELRYLRNKSEVESLPAYTADSVTQTTKNTTSESSNNQEDDHSITSDESRDISTRQEMTKIIVPALPSTTQYQFRTITATSPMILKHLFEPLNAFNNHPTCNDTILPSCLLVSNPTPDTLGRFLNAIRGATSDSGDKRKLVQVGWHITSSVQTIFYVSTTSTALKRVMNYLADYDKSAIVNGDTNSTTKMDFRFSQYIPRR